MTGGGRRVDGVDMVDGCVDGVDARQRDGNPEVEIPVWIAKPAYAGWESKKWR